MRPWHKWLIWIIATSFFSFQFVLRLFPGLLMSELMTQFKIGATDFGILSAAYYLGYSGMQIPVGIMLDRFHPRNVLSCCVLLCILGLLPFLYSDSWALVLLGRFLIGAGSAAGFLGTAKIIRSFFPESKFTSMVGLSFSLGLMGALYGGKPTNVLIERLGWHQVGLILAVTCLVIAFGIFVLFPSSSKFNATLAQSSQSQTQKVSVLASFRELVKYPRLFWIALAGALMVGPLEGFADVWGISYLVNVYGFSKSQASLVASFIYFGMLFGGPILSFFIQRYQAFYQVLGLCGLMMAGAFILMLTGSSSLTPQFLIVLMSFVGVLSCYQVVVFGLVCKIVPSHLSGLATSVTNCINMVAGSFFHVSMGWMMDYHWSGAFQDGIKIYESISYISAISLIPALLIFGFIGFLVLKKQSGQPVIQSSSATS